MKSIKEIVTKPSEALEAMVKGLKRQSKRKGFNIDMETYGDVSYVTKTCFGCAATCTVQEIAKKNFTHKTILYEGSRAAEFLGFEEEELMRFEYAIDMARVGNLKALFRFYNIDTAAKIKLIETYTDFELTTTSWREEIPKVKNLIKKLKELGL